MKKLKDLSKSERPREKIQAKGPEALSDLRARQPASQAQGLEG